MTTERLKTLPTLFVGHGSPLNAIEKNRYTEAFACLGHALPRPEGILVISAHWMTEGTKLLTSESPKTIHDFYGFPKELFEVQYPVEGAGHRILKLLRESESGSGSEIEESNDWGLDHGTWSILRHLFPDQSIPVTQLSLDRKLSLKGHFEVGRKLKELPKRGILVIGSGNLVHNLRDIDWEENAPAKEYAVAFDERIRRTIEDRRDDELYREELIVLDTLARKAHPTIDHYLPLLYVLGAAEPDAERTFPIEGITNGSISMRSVQFG